MSRINLACSETKERFTFHMLKSNQARFSESRCAHISSSFIMVLGTMLVTVAPGICTAERV